MVKTPGKRSTAAAALTGTVVAPPTPMVVKVDRGLQSLMDHGDNIEEFVAIFAHLPKELTADLQTVANLNEKAHRLTAELSRDQAEILERAKAKLRQATSPEHIEDLVDQVELNKALAKRARVTEELSRTVEITKGMYEKLDACINRVDDEISRLEADVKESYGAVPDYASLAPPEVVPEADLLAVGDAGAKKGLAAGAGTGGKGGVQAVQGVVGAEGAIAAVAQEVYNPNEPLYCICRQVGYGDMIGCDNDDCEHGEWFHYTCVGLEKKEYEFWLCPGCSRDAEEKKRRQQAEHLRMAAMMRTTADTNAVKADAVKLPSDGEDGEDDSDDDDEEDDDDDGDDGVKLEAISEGGLGSKTGTALASSLTNAAVVKLKQEGHVASPAGHAAQPIVKEEGNGNIAPSVAGFRTATGVSIGGGAGDPSPESIADSSGVGDDKSSMRRTPPVSETEGGGLVESASMRGVAEGGEWVGVNEGKKGTGVGDSADASQAGMNPPDIALGSTPGGAVVVVGVPKPAASGSGSTAAGDTRRGEAVGSENAAAGATSASGSSVQIVEFNAPVVNAPIGDNVAGGSGSTTKT